MQADEPIMEDMQYVKTGNDITIQSNFKHAGLGLQTHLVTIDYYNKTEDFLKHLQNKLLLGYEQTPKGCNLWHLRRGRLSTLDKDTIISQNSRKFTLLYVVIIHEQQVHLCINQKIIQLHLK